MKLRKTLAVIASLAMVGTMLAGCSDNKTNDTTTAGRYRRHNSRSRR